MTLIRISEGGPRVEGTFTFNPQDDQWGTAVIDGKTYDACLTFDGDGVIQLADNEVERYQQARGGSAMRWIVEVQRVDTSGDYAKLEHVERREFTNILEHDTYVGQVKQQYADQDDVQIVGNDHTEYKPTRLGRHYIF